MNIIEFIKMMDEVVPGFASSETRGLMMASVMGVLMGRKLIEANEE